mgnify:CR=1 FL=1|jgi:hypothetical protein
MPYDNNDIMQNVPERLRSKVKGIGLPEQMPQIQQESDTSFLQDLPLPGGSSLNTVAELTSNAIDSIKETNVYKKYFYNDAEKLAEAQKISNDLKIPVNAILANDTNMEKARDIYAYKQKQQQIMPNGEKTFDMKAVYAAYPELQRLANIDETQAAIALHNIENVKQTHGIIEAFKTGWHMDSLQLERSKLGQKGYFGELTDADRKRLTEIEEEMKNAKVLPDLLEAPVESIVGNTAQQAPMMFRQFMNGQMLAIGGAVAGAAVGATGGFTVGGVTAVPGAAYGARVGYGIGARLGYAKEMYQEILGNYYLDYIGYKDRQGRQLMSDNQARAWATVSALAETGIEMANVESVIGILGSEPGTKAAANIVRDIVRRGADSASAKAQLKDWLINNARNMGVVALSESAEEGVQNAVSMGINTMAAKANPGGNIPSYSAVEMAQGAMEGAWQALPASIGFGAMAAAGSNLKYVRKVATAANEGREYVENARKNEAGITMVDNLLNNKAANKLAKEQPEVYKNIIKNTLEGTGAENVYVDTELLLQQDGGVQILNQLAAAAGIEGQALQDVIETKADIAVPVQEYVNIDGAQELHDKLRDLISFAVGADCFARTRRIAQQMKKTYDKMIAGEMERALQNVHNLVEANFEEGPQRDMAEFILGQYEDPMEGIKEYREERQRELDEMLEPVLATMREGMGQGVAMLKDEETGHYYRMSNNDPWYSKYYAENKKAPSQSEMKQIAEDILTGNNYYGVPGFEFRDAESMEYAEANRAQIESIRSELATLDAIEEKIGNISKGELAATEGLTPEGIRVYNRVIEALKGASSKAVRKQEAMGALLTAHHAERYAEAMRRAGYKNYTAEDYLNRIRFEVNGNNATSGRFNQAAVYDWPQKAASNIVNITGNEFGEYENIKELRETAKKYYRTNLQGTTVYNPLIGEVRIERGLPDEKLLFSNRGLKEMVNKSANPIKLLAVKQLREIIENSRFLTHEESHEDKHAGEYFYYLHSKVNFNGEDHYVIVDIKEDIHGGMMYYTHNIFTEEEYRKENKKREDAKLATPKPRISSPGVEKQQASSFNNIITENGEVYNQSAYHGTPHSFERFDLGAIGTGEGAQAHGWGLYFAANKKTAEKYKEKLTRNRHIVEVDGKTYAYNAYGKQWYETQTGETYFDVGFERALEIIDKGEQKDVAINKLNNYLAANKNKLSSNNIHEIEETIKALENHSFKAKSNGALFEVDIPEDDVLLNEDATIKQQPPKVRQIIEKELERIGSSASNGKQFYNEIVFEFTRQGSENPQRAASEYLNRLGIKGITYEGARDGRCFVIFDDKAISIINRYNQTAYHGTPYSFEKFDLGAIGSGEGAQVHGWGLYFAKNRRIANKYKEVLGITHGIVQAGDITYTVNEDGEWLNTQTEEEVVYGTPLSYALTEYETAGSKHKAIENLKKDIAERQATDTDAAKKFVTAANEAIKILENNDFKVHNTPTVIEVDVPENKVLLDEQKPFKAQLKNVQKLITKAIQELPELQQLRFWESLIQRQLGDSDKTIKSRSELNNKKSLITSLQNLNDKNRPAHLKRATLNNLKSDGYTDEQINELQKDNQKLEREIEKYNAEIPALEEALNAAQEEDVKRNKEKIKQASANPAEALQSNLDTGEKIYQAFAYAVGGGEYNYRKASEYLNSQGIKGITYDGQQDGRCFVVFDDKAISIINRYNQSVGIHARTANRELLNEAQAMAAEGKMQREIYEKTGWRRGADGKWRFEIPDNLDKIDIKKLQSTKQFFTLGEIYDNEKLYEAYPFLREVTIQKEKLDGNRLGYSEGDYLIVIDSDVDEWFTPGTIIHELQHIIQNYEGFASGGNTRQVRTLVNEAIRKKTEEARSLAPHATMYYNRRREYEMAMIMGDEARMKELEGPIKKLEQEIPNKARRDRIYKLFSEADSLLRKANNMSDKQLYRNLYGEKEARAAEEKARISTRMERNRQKGNTQYDEILRDYTERLPEELQPVAKEYVDLIKRPLAERDFDRETEIEEKLLDNEVASEFYNEISDSQWEAAGTEELQKDYDETVFLPEKADAVVIFNDNLVASYSMAEPQVQGQTAILDNGKRIIYLYENADQSTFMHEMAHIFFADMRELAEMENAPAQIKRDWQTLQDWTAWNGSQINEYIGTAVYNEFNQRDKEIRAAQEKGYTYRGGERIELDTLLEEWRQERFARGFEEYLRKGKAPKESLKGVFTRFKNWLLKIYKDIKTIGAEPTKEVKAVMDRMLATQEEIDAVMQKEDIDAFRKAGGFKYLSGTSAEMWQKIYDDIHKDAYSKVIKVAMQDLTEQGQKEREQKIADERVAARERMSQEPVFIVWQYLQNNPQLDKEAAAQQIGNMTAEQYDFELNERGGSLDAAVDNYMRAYERELDAAAPDKDELARRAEEAVDTSYYKKLLTAYELEALDKSVQAEQKTSRKINDTADAGAAQAINRLDRARAKREGYEEEIKRLREQRGEERKQQRALRDVAVGNVDTIREYAERKISTLHVMEAANPVMWKKLSRQKARETEEAIAKNDWETARKAKKEQLVYDVMTDLATGNKKFVDKAVSTMKRRADIIRRDKNLSAYDRYVYNHLLYVFGMAKRDAPMSPDQPNFLDLLAGYENNLELSFVDAEGNITLPDWLLNAATATRPRDKGYIDLTVDGFKTFKDLMDNIYTVGREAKMAKAVTDRNGKKVDLDEAAAEIVTTIINTAFKKKTADRKFGNESVIEKSARRAEEASMNLIKPETILQAMGDTAMRYIYDPMREAANTEMRMNETLRQQQADIFAAYHDGKVAKYLAQGMDEKEARAAAEKELNEMGSKKQYSIGKENITKENLLAIALNWGTDINRKRVVDGYQVSYGFIEYALRQLDAADWQFVQNIWDLFETYWTDLQRVEANVTGVTLEKQPAVPFQIIGADGGVYNLNGGYYPLRYDPVKNNITALREINEAIKTKMQDATRLGTKLGSTKERSQGNVSLMIRTDLNVIDEVLGENIHNIAQRETIRDVNRLINNIDVKNAVETYWGKATWRTLNKWSLDCWAPEPQAKNIYEKASQRIRLRQTQAVLGFRVSTALLNICNIGPMMDYIGPIEATKAIKDFYLHPQRQYNTIMAKSVFLRNRAETMDRDFGRLVKDNSNSAITKSAFWLITKTDLMLACPLWMHEYQKAYQDGIAKGVDPVNVEAAAVRAGDAAVRRVFGSGQTVDMAEIQRGNEFTKQLTMFYSYFSVVHNAIALKVWEARKARVDGKKLTQAMAPVLTGIIFWMAIPAVIEAGIRAMIDDDDDDLADVAKGAGITFISTAVGGIPVLRDALPMALKAAAGEPVYNIRNNPLNETAAQMLNVTRAINSDNKDALDVSKAVLRMADMITGLPQILTDGMITAARWIDEGSLTEEDIQHYLWSILFGKNSKKN